MPEKLDLADRLFARWITLDIDSLENRRPQLIQRFTDTLGPMLDRWFRPEVRGLSHIPEGAALYVGNHNGATLTPDSYVFCRALMEERGIQDVPFGLMHGVAIKVPGVHHLFPLLGAVRASHANAHRLFEAGHKVLVYPGGDLDAMRPWRKRHRVVFDQRRGYIRLALRGGVPIVPVVAAGAHETFFVIDDGRWLARLLRADKLLRIKVFPITLSIPWGLTIGPAPPHFPWPSRILVEVLEPITFERYGEDAANDEAFVEACHLRVIQQMERTLASLLRERDT